MAVVTGVFLDTSVLLAGLIEMGPGSRSAQEVMTALAEGRLRRPRTAWHCCLEFYSVATRLPQEFRLTPADAFTLLEEEILGRFEVLDLPPGARLGFLRASAQGGVIGGRTYDAHIAEIARRAGTKLLATDNTRHFATVSREGVRVLTSAELAREL